MNHCAVPEGTAQFSLRRDDDFQSARIRRVAKDPIRLFELVHREMMRRKLRDVETVRRYQGEEGRRRTGVDKAHRDRHVVTPQLLHVQSDWCTVNADIGQDRKSTRLNSSHLGISY